MFFDEIIIWIIKSIIKFPGFIKNYYFKEINLNKYINYFFFEII